MLRHPRTVGELVTRAAAAHPHRAALKVRDGGQLTYAELDERTTRAANSLLRLGLVPGDRICAWMGDVPQYVEVYVAAAKAGLVVAPINARLVAPEAEYQLADSEAGALVFTPGVISELERLPARVLSELRLIAAGDEPGPSSQHWEDLIAQGSDVALEPPEPEALYILGYTSGTTGRPKGAMLTHASVLAIGRLNASSFRLPAHATIALTGSLSFVAVVPSHVLMTLRLAGTVVIMGRWTADDLLDVVESEHAVFTYIPSPLLSEVTEAIRRRPEAIASLHGVLHSASRADPEKLEALHQVVGGRLIEGLGMTEHSGGLVTATAAVDYLGARPGDPIFRSVGRTAVEVDVKVIGGDGQHELPWDGESVGELCFSSPALMAGYWKRPEATAEALIDGWYHSGDLGAVDPDGFVTVAERRTDLIVSGGANVYPSEVERCIAELPAVREVAVVGVPHPRWGQTVLAVVVADESQLDEAAIVEHCRGRLAGFKKPSRVLFMEQLPRTAGLKVARAALREQVLERLAAEVA